MAESNFIDYVKILCRIGKGGAGSAHLHRSKYIPKGGPDGATAAVTAISNSRATATCGR